MLPQLMKYLESNVDSVVSKLDKLSGQESNEGGPEITTLLKVAMKNERETSLLSCQWALNEKDPNFAMDLARLAGDEAKHYQLLADELERRNQSFAADDNFSPLYRFLEGQKDTFDRIITGPFAREYLATKRNRLFLEYCSKLGEDAVVKIYDTIQKDETHHFELGQSMVQKMLTKEEQLTRAQKLIDDFLAVVDDIQEILMLKKGLSYLPGC